MEDFYLPSLFQNDDYIKRSYFVDGEKYDLLSLNAACTDHDLTGLIIWPISEYLAWFVARKVNLSEKSCIELGAGSGLPGIVASKKAKYVVLTDGNELVLSLLERNLALNRGDHKQEVRRVCWGERSSVEGFTDYFDCVLGADVVAWPNSIEPLLQTVTAILATDGAFYCGFVVRALSTERLFFQKAQEFGFVVIEHDDTFLRTSLFSEDNDATPNHKVDNIPASIRCTTQKLRVLELRFRDPLSVKRPLSFISDHPEDNKWLHASLAC
uniref:Calmodulin-lysine N-methyltransferase n=1 Tax=Aureoumbra lagunensis TaxID=44058 RepID=A0A7S3JY49_9STRA|mmetsp:Transcript_7026/g.9856  ORF Transcript_7026/g.9856 Transcript_7026/m.9856 type:complete len:269 (+) Transcript_7026:126-932(+)